MTRSRLPSLVETRDGLALMISRAERAGDTGRVAMIHAADVDILRSAWHRLLEVEAQQIRDRLRGR